MPLILARHRAGSSTHFFDVEQQNGDDRKALCGFACGADELVQLQNLSDALPCELCIRDLPDDQLRPTQEEAAEEVLPSDDEDSAHTYAVSLRGEFVWHEVPEHPVMQVYQGREVVIAECGCIAFLVFGTPPERYARCPHCPALTCTRSHTTDPGPLPTAFPDAEVAGRFHPKQPEPYQFIRARDVPRSARTRAT